MKEGRQPAIHLALISAVAIAYFLVAKLGLSMAFVAEQVTAVWPPSGLSLAALLLLGWRVWPGIALGAFAANVTANEPVGTAVGVAVGNTLEAVIGAGFLRRFIGFDNSMERLRDVAGLILLAAGLSTTVSATIGAASLCLGGVQPWAAYGPIWLTWWLGDAMGNLVVAPVLLTLATRPRVRESNDFIQALLLAAGLALISRFVFSERLASPTKVHSLVYLVFPFVIWGAYRFGQRGTSLVVLLVSVGAILATIRGHGPFEAETIGQSLVLLQVFMGVVAITALTLGAAIAERNRAEVDKDLVKAAGDILASKLDCRESFPEVARVLSSHWRASCEIYVRGPEGVTQRAAVSYNGSGEPGIGDIHGQRVVFDPSTPVFAAAIESGKSKVWTVASPSPSWCMVAPLVVHGRGLGAIALCAPERRRRFDSEDVRVLEDVGQRAAIAIENAGLYSELKEADVRKDEWIAMLAHELRNPLAPISNALHIMAVPGVGLERIEQARRMSERQVQKLTRLVDDLLDVSRIMRGRIELRKQPTDLWRVIENGIESATSAIEAASQELIISRAEGPLWIDADAVRLEQIVANLLNNAAKFSSRPSRIWLTLERHGEEAVLTVRDEGMGIRPEFLPRVFDLFEQGNRSLERANEGLGIGLTIVRQLVELHDGSITAHSAGLGQGSTFVVRLPLAREPGDAMPPEEGRRDEEPFRAKRVLVVDDNVDAARSTAALIRLAGHTARVAFNGPEALFMANEFEPEVLFIDIAMPGMNGYEVAQNLRRRAASTPPVLIALTGYGQESDRLKTREAGFDHHLTKPVDPEVLQKLIVSD